LRTTDPERSKDVRASVVVPTHGGAHRLPELLDALAAQEFDGDWELIVVVDGVVDDTVSVLEGYRDRLPLRMIVHEVARGVVAALNDAFAQARGEVLIRCDDDLSPRPDFVRRHVAHHVGRTDIGVIGPTRDVFPDNAYARAYGRSATARSLEAAYGRPESERYVGWAANNSVHRDAWACAGGFSPRFVYGQDSELGWRLSRHCGVRMVVDPELQVDHRGPSTSAATRVPRAFVSGASKRLFYAEHPTARPDTPRPSGLRGLAWLCVVAALAGAVRSKQGHERLGRWVDTVLAVVPPRIGGIVTAVCVEAAGRSGLRNGEDDLTVYKTQKAAERSRELQLGTRSRSMT
jgi:GT2 family glycosyltransferase